MAFRSSCLAGTLVAFGRQAAWWPGAHCAVFVKPVTPAQEAKTVVANGAAVLTFTHQRWPKIGRASASVHSAHKTLVDLSRRVRCIVCFAAAAFMLLCAATAGAFGTVVVVHFPF